MKTLTKAAIGLSAAGAAYLLIEKSRSEISVEAPNRVEVHGFVSSGYEAVREAFKGNFFRRRELGAACCVYHKGEKVAAHGPSDCGELHSFIGRKLAGQFREPSKTVSASIRKVGTNNAATILEH